jgi:hypothetical protein
VPNDDVAPVDAGPDLYVVIRTSDSASYGDPLAFEMPSNTAVTYFDGDCAVNGITTETLTVNMPLNLRDLVTV